MKSRVRKTYIVNHKEPDGTIKAYSLLDWCALKGLNYNTVLSRIWRVHPYLRDGGGVIFFNADDKVLSPSREPLFEPSTRTTETDGEHTTLPKGARISRTNRLEGQVPGKKPRPVKR